MYQPFKNRIKSWSEKKVIAELDVRKLKITQAERDEKPAQARRLNSEFRALGERLVEIRNLELFPVQQADAPSPEKNSDATPQVAS